MMRSTRPTNFFMVNRGTAQNQGAYPQYQMNQQYSQQGAYQPQAPPQPPSYSPYNTNGQPAAPSMAYSQAPGPQVTGQSPSGSRLAPYPYQMSTSEPGGGGGGGGVAMQSPPSAEVATPTKGGRGKGKSP